MKLDLILENVRNKYSLGLLEESSELSEKQLLQGKILINESTMAIRSMLVEEGTIETVKGSLEEAWTDAVIQAGQAIPEVAEEEPTVGDGLARGAATVAGAGLVGYGTAKALQTPRGAAMATKVAQPIRQAVRQVDATVKPVVRQAQAATKQAQTGYRMGAANAGLSKVASRGSVPTRVGNLAGRVRRTFR